jgi:hypothetical protein
VATQNPTDVLNASDDVIQEEIANLIGRVGAPGPTIYLATAELYLAELHRRSAQRLERSSRRLEYLTWALLVLTFVLALLAVPPAFVVGHRWLSYVVDVGSKEIVLSKIRWHRTAGNPDSTHEEFREWRVRPGHSDVRSVSIYKLPPVFVGDSPGAAWGQRIS